jgi:hypothetical protein
MQSPVDISDVLDLRADPAVLTRVNSDILQERAHGRLPLDVFLCPDVADRMAEDGWSRIRAYCLSCFGEDIISPYLLVPCLLRLFRPAGVGVWIGPATVRDREPRLLFDDDGLLLGPSDYVTFTKEGALTSKHYLLYAPLMPGVGLSGGFLEDLLTLLPGLTSSRCGLAIAEDVILLRSYHQESFTKAYIRGPRGLDVATLQDPSFPQDPTGVVTEHLRTTDIPHASLFPLSRVEIMWSMRHGIKTIQMEELVTIDGTRAATAHHVNNRYIHARWDPLHCSFVHLDGAIRSYTSEQYGDRLRTDIKKYPVKAAAYRKLFRIDGRIPVDAWSRLTAKFFHENELVMEYLGGPHIDGLA